MRLTTRFWIPLGGLLLAAVYLPTLAMPFDFVDDGNLVYPAPAGTTLRGHAELWWEKVAANYEHLGPFRPVLWVHWELEANLFHADAMTWRAARLAWCALAAGMLLWLFQTLGVRPLAALFAGMLAMANPYRNETWTSLTLAEGVAMPYALLGLIAARKAAVSDAPLKWDLVGIVAVLAALGCKNVYAAIVPAQMLLRLWPDGATLRDSLKQRGLRAALLGITLLLPAAHFIYFKQHWHPGQYETVSPSFAQAGRLLNSLKGAVSLDYLAPGLLLAVVVVMRAKTWTSSRPVIVAALLLVAGGTLMYLPFTIISGRYTMPAVWGLDILFALLLSALAAAPRSLLSKAAWVALGVGLVVVMASSFGRQERVAARQEMLWDALRHVEQTAPPGTTIAWISGDQPADLNVEEGIHFQWHLFNRGRQDIRVVLLDAAGKPLSRVEAMANAAEPTLRLSGSATPAAGWTVNMEFRRAYWFDRRAFVCHLSRRLRMPE